MIKHSKRVLKFINGNTSSKGIAPSNVSLNLKIDYDKVCEIIDYLCEKELLKQFDEYLYISTSKGRDYFKNLYSNFFFKFIYPIITASISFVLSMLLK